MGFHRGGHQLPFFWGGTSKYQHFVGSSNSPGGWRRENWTNTAQASHWWFSRVSVTGQLMGYGIYNSWDLYIYIDLATIHKFANSEFLLCWFLFGVMSVHSMSQTYIVLTFINLSCVDYSCHPFMVSHWELWIWVYHILHQRFKRFPNINLMILLLYHTSLYS